MPNENDNKLVTLADLAEAYNALYNRTPEDIGAVSKTGDQTIVGDLHLKPSSGEGGQIRLDAASDHPEQAGINIDRYGASTFRILGEPSADTTSITGVGTPLEIDPYAKTIVGGYTFTGNVIGDCSGAVKNTVIDKTDKITISSTKGTISNKSVKQYGKLVAINFLFTSNTTIDAYNSFGITATFQDNSLKPLMRLNGGSNNYHIATMQVSPTSNGMDIIVSGDIQLSTDTSMWLTCLYLCA